MTGFYTLQPCMDCGVPTDVADPDEYAVCPTCVKQQRERERLALLGDGQAGAQHVGRERFTRDDPDGKAGRP